MIAVTGSVDERLFSVIEGQLNNSRNRALCIPDPDDTMFMYGGEGRRPH